MGFFNSTPVVESGDIFKNLMNEDLNLHEDMSIMEACYADIAATEMNWNAIMEAAAETELAHMAKTGEEYFYEASELGAKISAFISKIWEKIKSLFKKFLAILGSLGGKDKDFVKNHKATILASVGNIPKDAKVKGFNYTTSAASDKVAVAGNKVAGLFNSDGSMSSEASKYVSADGSFDATEAAEKLRGEFLGGDKMKDSDFRKAVYKLCRNGKDEMEDITVTKEAVEKALKELEGGDKAKKEAKELYSKTEKAFKDLISKANKLETKKWKEKDVDTDGATSLNRTIALAKNGATAIQVMCAVYLTAVKEYYTFQRKMCVRVVTYKTPKHEGATIEHVAEGAFAKVSLI